MNCLSKEVIVMPSPVAISHPTMTPTLRATTTALPGSKLTLIRNTSSSSTLSVGVMGSTGVANLWEKRPILSRPNLQSRQGQECKRCIPYFTAML